MSGMSHRCSWFIVCALLPQTVQQEEGVGREQRRRADGAVREVKALREEVDRLKDARTVSALFFGVIMCVYRRTLLGTAVSLHLSSRQWCYLYLYYV